MILNAFNMIYDPTPDVNLSYSFQGTHIESPSTMFGTVICYLAVRLLGGNKDYEWIRNGREFIQREGGAIMTSSWAKFWLCLVGCMDWKGHNSVPRKSKANLPPRHRIASM